ncbi:ATP:cob(I)alamin adenosyltransferase [bacterium]|nr:ATP:cob(I)alamin adenosyltransferase [bacterium]
MARISKIVTKQGDGGQTGLGDGKRVSKHNLRVVVYGEVDELNSFIGVCISLGAAPKDYLEKIQNDLFDIGGDLCFPESKNKRFMFSEKKLAILDENIEIASKDLPPLENFILPGGSAPSAFLHLARCVARRAERSFWLLSDSESVNLAIGKYLNRLSDYLFILARKNGGEEKDIWNVEN